MRKLAVALGCALLVPTTPALAASTTVGSSLSFAGSANLPTCGGGFDCVAFTTNSGTPVAVSPYDGVVTVWRVRSGSATSPVKLRVLRPGAGGSYTAVGTSGTQMTTGAAAPDEYPSNILVDKGDVLAIGNDSEALLYAAAAPTFTVNYWAAAMGGQPAFADGTSGAPPEAYGAHEVAMNATIVEAQADVSVGVLESADPVTVGNELSYLVSVTNNGPQPAKAVSLTDQLPDGVSLVSATPSVGTCGTQDPVTCELGTLAVGATATVTIKVTPTATGTIANAVSAATTTVEANPGNNASTVTTTVVEQSQQQQQDTPAPVLGTVTFTPARFRLGSFLPQAVTAAAKKPPIGTTVQYLSSNATAVTFRFQRLRKGKPPRAAGSLTRPGAAFGATTFRFSGRLSATRKLKPGRYRVTVVAKSATAKSDAVRKTITVLKR